MPSGGRDAEHFPEPFPKRWRTHAHAHTHTKHRQHERISRQVSRSHISMHACTHGPRRHCTYLFNGVRRLPLTGTVPGHVAGVGGDCVWRSARAGPRGMFEGGICCLNQCQRGDPPEKGTIWHVQADIKQEGVGKTRSRPQLLYIHACIVFDAQEDGVNAWA